MRYWRGSDAPRAAALRERAMAAYLAWGALRKVHDLRDE
jgi:hypothetical protein